jgi:hypothetical protein
MRHVIAATGAIAFVYSVIACTDPVSPATVLADSDASTAPIDEGDSAAPISTGAEKKDAGTIAPSCEDATTEDACVSCCVRVQSKGAKTYQGLLQACVCRPEHCEEACGPTVCATEPANPDDACMECITAKQVGSTCQPEVMESCAEDADCTAFFDCRADSQCADKPAQ